MDRPYADYTDYTENYYGTLITDETVFLNHAVRASHYIDALTCKRLRDWTPEDEGDVDDIRMACCAFCDYLYCREYLATAALSGIGVKDDGTGKAVASITSGSESISFANTSGTSGSTLEGEALKDMESKSQRMGIAYLGGIRYADKPYSILFRGVGCE